MAFSSSLYHQLCCDNQSNQGRPPACWYRYHLPRVHILSYTLWDVSYMANVNSASALCCSSITRRLSVVWNYFNFNFFQLFSCQYSISFTCSTERGGVRARLTACVSVVYCKRKRNILWNVRVFRGIIKALKQQPRPIWLNQYSGKKNLYTIYI